MISTMTGTQPGRRVRAAVAAAVGVGALIALGLVLTGQVSSSGPAALMHHRRPHSSPRAHPHARNQLPNPADLAEGELPRCGGGQDWPQAYAAGKEPNTCIQLCLPPEYVMIGHAHGARFGKSCVDDFGCSTFVRAEQYYDGFESLVFSCPKPLPPAQPCVPARTGDARLTAYPKGIVEVFQEADGAKGDGPRAGSWGSLCGLFFREDTKGADVVCRQLGYARSSGALPETVDRHADEEAQAEPVTRLGTSCKTGDEPSLARCEQHSDDKDGCFDHNYDVRISCVGTKVPHSDLPREYCEVPAYITKGNKKDKHKRRRGHDEPEAPRVRETCDGAARLTDYPTGLVQTYDFAEGGWGNLCGLQFRSSLVGPSVVCRELGYPEGALSVSTHDRSRSKDVKRSPLHIMAPVCNGTEEAVLECPRAHEVKEGDCKDHKFDAEVTCKGERVPLPGRAGDDPYRFANHTDCATVARAAKRLQAIIDAELSLRARQGKMKADDFDFHIDMCGYFERTTKWTGDYAGDDWYCPPSDVKPTRDDPNPWCPDKFVQDAWMFWPFVPQDRALRQPECRTVCIPPLFKSIAYKHGLSYGTTCYELGCRRAIGGFTKFGVHAYRFACDDVEEEQWPEGVEPES